VTGAAAVVGVWAALLGALTAILWIWSGGDAVAVGVFGAATGLMAAVAAALLATGRRRRPERAGGEVRAMPDLSFGTVILCVGLAAMLYGAVLGLFLVWIGGGVALAGLGRLAMERRGEREAVRRALRREAAQPAWRRRW
jgi:MFS superfamily sulfate permease-like transporter